MTLPTLTEPDQFLAIAKRSLDWVRASARISEQGVRWEYHPDEPGAPDPLGAGPDTFYSGNAGIVLALLELHQVTGDPALLDEAILGARQIATSIDTTDYAGFYTGLSGIAFSLAQAAEATGDETLRAEALRATRRVVAQLHHDGEAAAWSDQLGILFDGGAALYLLWASEHFSEQGFVDAAAAFGRHLLRAARPDPRGGASWQGMEPAYHGVEDATWPNFFYGTAGTGFILARLAEATGQAVFLDAAQRAATNLRAIADRIPTPDGEGALIHYRDPDRRHHHYLGLCQGPIGTARFFHQLAKVTGDDADARWVELLGNGLVLSGAPQRHSIGYWNVDGLCCGGAGMIEFHLARWATTGDDTHLFRAEDTARYVAGNAVDPDGRGPRWATAFTRVTPWDVHASSDWGHGASGIATALAHAWSARRGGFRAIRLPDDPFPQEYRA